ncbi:hypothetical protein LY474_12740 [Myxococcus stipitatus]|uniref:DUF6891 domain-containing protein n=1 Tax=Myxococcus stipitatus TaxID=83455 RepID=UPI001F30AE22|nr:hypothetical protein [Myxococcus stipitatus]MCE9668683.1 hypothetical protein [Myxococcus stipitatus]
MTDERDAATTGEEELDDEALALARSRRAREVAGDLLAGVKGVQVGGREGVFFVCHDVLNEDTGEVLEFMLATTRSGVMRPVLAARLGLLPQVEEVARRLRALADEYGFGREPPAHERVRALAREVLERVGLDGVVDEDDEGHLVVRVEEVDRERLRVVTRTLATTRGDVPRPALMARLGWLEPARELARRLSSLGFAPEPTALTEEEARQLAQAEQDLRRLLDEAMLPLDTLLWEGQGLSLPDARDEDGEVWRRLLRWFPGEVRARWEAEKGWPDVLETDRLEAAFEALRARGLVAEMGATETLSGGWTLVLERADAWRESGAEPEPWGGTYFHMQDIEAALEGHPLHLAFGHLDEDAPDAEDARVAEAVLAALREHGFDPSWSGNVHSRIQVLPAFTWRRRRARIDTQERTNLVELAPELVELLPRLRTLTIRAGYREVDFRKLSTARSSTVETLVVTYDEEAEAREELPDLLALAGSLRKERFPRLHTLVVEDDGGFQETHDLG